MPAPRLLMRWPWSGNVTVAVDVLPGASVKELMQSLDDAGQRTPHRQCKTVIADFLPQKIGLVCLQNAGISAERKIHELNKREKSSLIDCIKALSLTIQRPRPLTEAMITQGGVATREINPKTMESKIVSGLYFCGEVIDIAGLSGGFNLAGRVFHRLCCRERGVREGLFSRGTFAR